MNKTPTGEKLAVGLSLIIGIILALIPFHAFLTVWLSSGLGHYTALRLWKEGLLFILSAGSIWLLITRPELRRKFIHRRLTQLITIYCLLTVVWGVVAYALGKVTAKALGYGLIVNLRFLIFFLVAWLVASTVPKLKHWWPKLLLVPSAVVVLFGLAQEVILPHDFLKHFGYGQNTIYPYETVNHNLKYLRVMSTLRGANPLGAYLILIISTISTFGLRAKRRRFWWGAAWLIAVAAMVLSYSREAWLGLGLSLIWLAWLALRTKIDHRRLGLIVAGLLIVAAVAGLVLRQNTTIQNVFLHTQSHSAVSVSSNQQHASAFRSGLHDVFHQPLGEGVGTAGPASVYNKQTRIAENYFIQIAQEVGWLGLILFVAINWLVAKELWTRRADSLALILLVSLAGLSVVAMFSHAWTDDTLAYLWWGLAGIALAPGILSMKAKRHAKET